MIKNIEKIVYDRLSTASEYLALNPKPTIHQEVAPLNTDNPVIIINSISGRSTLFGVRVELIQFSVWTNQKDDITPIRNALAQIFNRWISEDVEYTYIQGETGARDPNTNEFGRHMSFIFKVYDPEY